MKLCMMMFTILFHSRMEWKVQRCVQMINPSVVWLSLMLISVKRMFSLWVTLKFLINITLMGCVLGIFKGDHHKDGSIAGQFW